MDELKKYLQQNRASLDVDEPSPAVWERMELPQPVQKKSNVLIMTRWVAAACILVLAGIGTWSLLNTKKITEQPVLTATTQPVKPNQETVINKPVPEENPIDEETLASVKQEPKKKISLVKPVTERPDLIAMNNIENSFKQVINLQRDKVSTTPMFTESAEYFNDFKIQIKQLEKDEKTIKSEIVKRGMTDELLTQLINIYQIKLNTLKQLQTEMNKINNRYKQNRAPVDSTRTYFINI